MAGTIFLTGATGVRMASGNIRGVALIAGDAAGVKGSLQFVQDVATGLLSRPPSLPSSLCVNDFWPKGVLWRWLQVILM